MINNTDIDRLYDLITSIENELMRSYSYTTDTFRIEQIAKELSQHGVTFLRSSELVCPDPDLPNYWQCANCGEDYYFTQDPDPEKISLKYCSTCGALLKVRL